MPTIEITVPDMGNDSIELDIIDILVKEGDSIKENQTLCVLESSKSSFEVDASCDGEILRIYPKLGDTISPNQKLFEVSTDSENSTPSKESSEIDVTSSSKNITPTQANEKSEPLEEIQKLLEENSITEQSNKDNTKKLHSQVPIKNNLSSTTSHSQESLIYAGPATRKLAREMNIDLSHISGSGKNQRITTEDIKQYVKMLSTNQVQHQTISEQSISKETETTISMEDFSAYGEVTLEKMKKIDQFSAENLTKAWQTIPHVSAFIDIDVTETEQFRYQLKESNPDLKFTLLPFIIKAVSIALKKHPKLNASINMSTKEIYLKSYFNIGFALNTEDGLLVPVINDVNQKQLSEIANDLSALIDKGKNKKLTPNEMLGASFTVSSLGRLGGRGFTPIINPPEVGIIGIGNLSQQPIWENNQFIPRKMLPITLSYDHRVINGVYAGEFLETLSFLLKNPTNLIL